MDAVKSGEGLIGFWSRRPVGVIAAITPFNFPLNLVAHKVAPALAAGNAVILKPAELTPFSSALLCDILMEAGLLDGCLNLVLGGRREGAVHWPTILDQVKPDMRVVREEVFGPVVSLQTFHDFEDAPTIFPTAEPGRAGWAGKDCDTPWKK